MPQVIVFLHTLAAHNRRLRQCKSPIIETVFGTYGRVLVLVPLNVLFHWRDEIREKWMPRVGGGLTLFVVETKVGLDESLDEIARWVST
eukprot:740452-Prorocentrum_minimum.AAC.1